MNLDKNIRESLIKCMQLLEAASNEVDPLQCDSNLERKVKELLQVQIKTSIADVLMSIETLYEVEFALEEGTGLLTVYVIALENFNGYENASTN